MKEQEYWTKRYVEKQTGWDIGYPSTPIKEYIDQLNDKGISILIPGAGNAYEAEYLLQQGFTNVSILDISPFPLKKFKKRNPHVLDHQLIQADFFQHHGKYDLILEQTFFCSMLPSQFNRESYARHMAELLKEKGKLVGLWFDIPLGGNTENRPFGGDKALYLSYLTPYFNVKVFESCTNSIEPRSGKELFGIFCKKQKELVLHQ